MDITFFVLFCLFFPHKKLFGLEPIENFSPDLCCKIFKYECMVALLKGFDSQAHLPPAAGSPQAQSMWR